MPNPIPNNQQIEVSYLYFDKPFSMDSLQMATDHFNIGFTLQGYRRTITPLHTYTYQAGDVALAPPYMYHRTLPNGKGPYERIMIKFTRQFVQPFIDQMGEHTFLRLYESLVYHFTKDSQKKLRNMFFDILEVYKKNAPYREFILQGMLFRLFTTVLEEHIPAKFEAHPSPLSAQIIDALAYMENHYKSQPSLSEVASYVGFSAGYFSRLFHSQLGMPYGQYLTNIQIRNVQILLTNTDMTIMDIANETGYCHGDYLSAQFKKKVGMTPSQYRRTTKNSAIYDYKNAPFP